MAMAHVPEVFSLCGSQILDELTQYVPTLGLPLFCLRRCHRSPAPTSHGALPSFTGFLKPVKPRQPCLGMHATYLDCPGLQ